MVLKRFYAVIVVLSGTCLLGGPLTSFAQVSKQALSLLPGLQSNDPSEREEAAKESCSVLSPELAASVLIELMGDSDLDVRLAAINAVGKLGSIAHSALPFLAKCSRDPEPSIKKACITSIGDVGANSPDMIEVVTAALKDDNRDIRSAAVDALFTTDAAIELKIQGLVHALSDSDAEIRIAAAQDLGDLPKWTKPEVLRLGSMLHDDSVLVRVAAAKSLQKLNADIDDIIPEVIKTIADDKNEDVRVVTIGVLRNTSDATSVLTILTRALRDPSWHVRRAAIQNIGTASKDPLATSPFLIEALLDKTNSVREAAAGAAAKLTDASPELIITLSKTLRDPDPDLRYLSAKALGSLPSMAILDPLILSSDSGDRARQEEKQRKARAFLISDLVNSLKDTDPQVRIASADALAQIARKRSLRDVEEKTIVSAIAGQLLDDNTTVLVGMEKALIALCDDTTEEVHGLSPMLRTSLLNLIGTRLIALASHSDNDIRFLTVQLLGRLPLERDQLQSVVAALDDHDADVRRVAITALGNSDFHLHALGVFAGLENPDARSDSPDAIRRNGIAALAELPERANVIVALVRQLKSSEQIIREHAIKSLGNNLSQADGAIRCLEEGSAVDDAEASRLIVDALRALSSPVSEGYNNLIASLADPDFIVQLGAVQAFRTIRPNEAAIEKLLVRLRDKDSKIREEAAITVGKLHDNPIIIAALLQVLEKDSTAAVRLAALDALIDLGETNDEYVRILTNRMADSSDDIREKAIGELSRLKVHDPLLIGLESGDVLTRRRCVDHLAVRDSNNPERLIPALRKAAHDPDRHVRLMALVTLTAAGQTAVPELIAGLKDPTGFNRGFTAKLLRDVGKDNDSVYHAVNDVANSDSNLYAVTSAIESLTDLGRIETVIADIRSENPLTRQVALRVLNQQGLAGVSAIPNLTLALKDESPQNRILAAQTLAFFGSEAKGATPVLVDLMTSGDTETKRAAVNSLGWIGSDARIAIPRLINALKDPNLSKEAHDALLRILSDQKDAASASSLADPELQIKFHEIQKELENNRRTATLNFTLYKGGPTTISIDTETIVIAMGTWCPYSQGLREFLVNERYRMYLRNHRLVFLFEDEWLHEQDKLIEEHNWNPEKEAQLSAEKHQLGDQAYQNPSFLESLEGTIYTLHSLKEIGVKYYPSILSPAVLRSKTDPLVLTPDNWINVDDWKETSWFNDHILMPKDVREELRPHRTF